MIHPMVHDERPAARGAAHGGLEEAVALLAPRLAQFAAVARLEHVTRAALETGVLPG
jgi:hypothetical protein